MSVRVRVRGRRACAVAALAVLCAACVRVPVELASRAHFPRAQAHDVAHLLADFSTHPHASPGAWRVRDERGNYSEWQYRVSYECGARCSGEASVRAAAHGAPSHGRARRHRVRAHLAACARPPLLPWPRLCDSVEVEWEVSGAGAGCVVQEAARAWCAALRVLSGACARDLRALRDRHVRAVRLRLAHHEPAFSRLASDDR